jgi:hypothetical protein
MRTSRTVSSRTSPEKPGASRSMTSRVKVTPSSVTTEASSTSRVATVRAT